MKLHFINSNFIVAASRRSLACISGGCMSGIDRCEVEVCYLSIKRTSYMIFMPTLSK